MRYKVIKGDTVPVCDLSAVTVGGIDYSKSPKFRTKRQSYKYRKMTRYVKKVYPYAQLASQKLIECEAEIKKNPVKDSYTNRLLDSSTLAKEKVLEEINELIEAVEKDSNKIHEAADVFYHLIMYLEKNEIDVEDVMKELENRRK